LKLQYNCKKIRLTDARSGRLVPGPSSPTNDINAMKPKSHSLALPPQIRWWVDQRSPLPDGALQIVTRGEKEDGEA
jgi:hypothetical protein